MKSGKRVFRKKRTLFCSVSLASASSCAFFRISSTNADISSIFCGSSQNSAIRTFSGIWFGLDKSKLIWRIRRWESDSTGFTSKSNLVLEKCKNRLQNNLFHFHLSAQPFLRLLFHVAFERLPWNIHRTTEIVRCWLQGICSNENSIERIYF